MSHSNHSRVHRATRIDREGTTRTTTRTAIDRGDFDALETRMSSRSNRRGNLAA